MDVSVETYLAVVIEQYVRRERRQAAIKQKGGTPTVEPRNFPVALTPEAHKIAERAASGDRMPLAAWVSDAVLARAETS